MKFMEINKQIKEKIEHVYRIVGADVYLIKQAINNIKSFLIKDFEEFDFVKMDADKLKAEETEAIISTLPLGNEYRLVVLNNPSADVQKFINKYNFEDSFVVVICVNADKVTIGEEIDCSKLDKIDISKYCLHYLKKSNISIEELALDYLIDATNGDMAKIQNELNKLVSYAHGQEIITIDMVTNLVSNSNEYAIYMLTNAIDKKDFTMYQKILNEMSKSVSFSDLFAFMGKYFKRMQYIALNKNDDELAKILNIKPYAVKMSRQYVQQNGIKFYINLYQKYVDLQYKVKSGEVSVNNALYLLIM